MADQNGNQVIELFGVNEGKVSLILEEVERLGFGYELTSAYDPDELMVLTLDRDQAKGLAMALETSSPEHSKIVDSFCFTGEEWLAWLEATGVSLPVDRSVRGRAGTMVFDRERWTISFQRLSPEGVSRFVSAVEDLGVASSVELIDHERFDISIFGDRVAIALDGALASSVRGAEDGLVAETIDAVRHDCWEWMSRRDRSKWLEYRYDETDEERLEWPDDLIE